MANTFVWSGATGLADGTTWEDAYTSVMIDWGAEAGFTAGTDFAYIRSTHAESTAGLLTVTGNTAEGTEDPVRILCVVGADTGTTPGNLTTGATVTTTGSNNIELLEKLWIHGVKFIAGNNLLIGGASVVDSWIWTESCDYELTSGGAGAEIRLGTQGAVSSIVNWRNADVTFGAVGQGVDLSHGTLIWEKGILNTNLTNLFESIGSIRSAIGRFRNIDLSILTGQLVDETTLAASCDAVFERCLLHASTTVTGTIDIPGVRIRTHLCQAGTDADPAYEMSDHTYQGVTTVDTARYRTGGASDGERTNPVSWDMETTTSSNAIELYEALESPPIATWTDGDASTAHVYRVHVASGGTLNDDDLWIDITGPNSAATNSLGELTSTRMAPLGSPAALTSDTGSTWTGADVGTKQYAQVSYTPDKPGPVTCRVYLAQPSQRVSVDPVIVIDP